jgi:hypothetical protein
MEPVVTQYGHLYCWPSCLLYQWLELECLGATSAYAYLMLTGNLLSDVPHCFQNYPYSFMLLYRLYLRFFRANNSFVEFAWSLARSFSCTSGLPPFAVRYLPCDP